MNVTIKKSIHKSVLPLCASFSLMILTSAAHAAAEGPPPPIVTSSHGSGGGGPHRNLINSISYDDVRDMQHAHD